MKKLKQLWNKWFPKVPSAIGHRIDQPGQDYKVRYVVKHDGKPVVHFDIVLKATSKPHAYAILKQHVTVTVSSVTNYKPKKFK